MVERKPIIRTADVATASSANGGGPQTFAQVEVEIAAAMAAGELSLPQKFEWFERKLKAALADSSVSASELAKIGRETDVAIEVARQEALAARERGLDFCAVADARLAREAIEDSEFFVSRLLTQRPRLQALLDARLLAERRDAYLVRYGELKEEGGELAQALTHAYPDAVRQIVEVFAKLAAFRQKASALHHGDPGSMPHLSDPELKARRLDAFSGEVKSLLDSVRLPDWQSGREIWPPFQPPFAAEFALPVPQHPGAAWCSPEYLAAQQAERVAEQAKMAANYATQAAEQELRENKTLRENWIASQRRT